MLNKLGEWQTLDSRAHSLWKPRGNPSYSQPDQNQRQYPEFLPPCQVLSFGNHRWLLSNHPDGLACSRLLSSFRLLPWNPSVELVLPLATRLSGKEVLQIYQTVHSSGGQESILLSPGLMLVSQCGMIFPAQTSVHSRRVCPLTNPF